MEKVTRRQLWNFDDQPKFFFGMRARAATMAHNPSKKLTPNNDFLGQVDEGAAEDEEEKDNIEAFMGY